jgi:hypothetical protein
MKPKISEQEINAVLNYIEQFGDQPVVRTFQEDYTDDETGIVFPAIEKLLLYGASKEPERREAGKPSLAYLHSNMKGNNYIYTKEIVSKQSPLLRQLLSDYESETIAQLQDNLFKMTLSDMNGYEFQDYAKRIGLIK